MIAKDADGKVSVKQTPDQIGRGTGVGLAVGSLTGVPGGTGCWRVARLLGCRGVGLDFVEKAITFLTPASDCTVTLRGSVSSWAERDQAVSAAWAAPGVNSVHNELTVST